jgi:phospholipase C
MTKAAAGSITCVRPWSTGSALARVPALIVSPYARRGLLAHGQYDHASVLKLIEWRFGLEPLTARDRDAGLFLEALDFSQPPRPPIALP